MINSPKIDKHKIEYGVIKVIRQIVSGKQSGQSVNNNDIRPEEDIFNKYALDSLESLDFLAALEDEFQVSPDQYEANDKRSLNQIVDYVADLLVQNNKTY